MWGSSAKPPDLVQKIVVMPFRHQFLMVQDIIVGRPRDGDDRVAWLLEHQRFQRALDIIEKEPSLRAATRAQTAERYLDHLIAEERFAEAAKSLPRLLQVGFCQWELVCFLLPSSYLLQEKAAAQADH